jgi:FixJ family two-component response regulator
MGGIRLLDRVQKFEAHLPVIVLTGHGDVPMAVQAMKSGAFDFIEKPANFQQLLHRVQEALERVEDGLGTDRVRRAQESEQANFQRLLRLLSPRERQVLDRLVDGASGKMIASELGISERTVEKHREHAMHKLGARSLAELIAMATSHITQT